MPEDASFQPTAILITGGAGFIGSHVVDAVLFEFPNVPVYVLDIYDYMASEHNLDDAQRRAGKRLKIIRGDFCSTDLVRFVLKEYEIDTIMHIGAMTHVCTSFGNSMKFTRVNVFGTHVLLESAKEYGKIRRFIHCSTDETYGESKSMGAEIQAFDENSPFEPSNPYAATKAAAECMAKAYYHSYGLPVIITRGNNTYGHRQFPEKCIPRFMALIKEGKPLTVHGQGKQRRSFLHVLDVAQAFVTILKRGNVGEVYNIGTEYELSIVKLAKKLLALYNRPVDMLVFTKDRAFNDRRYFISNEKLKKLGWRPQISFDEGILQTKRWYEKTDLETHWPQLSKAFEADTGYVEE